MAENMTLNDEAMANASGGSGEDLPLNKYNVGDRVIVAGLNSSRGGDFC